MTADRQKLRALAEQATRGPWHWAGQKNSYGGPELCTWLPGQGRCIVMDFVRLGSRSAQPRFALNGLLQKGNDLAVREVEYRADIARIDHPDATFIAAANPDVVLALLDEIESLEARAFADGPTAP